MSKFTSKQYGDMLARLQRNSLQNPISAEPVESEADLHAQIIQFCRDMGWFYVHSRMDRRTTTAEGVPDFIIATDGGVTVWVECKSRHGKLSTKQLASVAHLTNLGHQVHVVKSLPDLVNAIR